MSDTKTPEIEFSVTDGVIHLVAECDIATLALSFATAIRGLADQPWEG